MTTTATPIGTEIDLKQEIIDELSWSYPNISKEEVIVLVDQCYPDISAILELIEKSNK